jgi:hypothetical protein
MIVADAAEQLHAGTMQQRQQCVGHNARAGNGSNLLLSSCLGMS